MPSITAATRPTKFNACCALLINSILLVFFAIYTYNNPDIEDDRSCYVSKQHGKWIAQEESEKSLD